MKQTVFCVFCVDVCLFVCLLLPLLSAPPPDGHSEASGNKGDDGNNSHNRGQSIFRIVVVVVSVITVTTCHKTKYNTVIFRDMIGWL